MNKAQHIFTRNSFQQNLQDERTEGFSRYTSEIDYNNMEVETAAEEEIENLNIEIVKSNFGTRKVYHRNRFHAPWADLPREILSKIFSYLTVCDTEMVESTCVSWRIACNDPYLWRRVVFKFDGTDSLRLLADALRLIASKGQYTRDLELNIGRPGMNRAWLMSGCIQQLLDFICQSPCNSIEAFRISNLAIFTQNRFFKLSKESILCSLNKFLRCQRNLKCVSFSNCRFHPDEGMKILRALKFFRPTLRHLELHDFFKRRYVSATKASRMLSTLTFLEDLRVDADYINDKMLMWFIKKWPNRRPLKHVKIYFESMRPPPTPISMECWLAVRKCFEHLKVSYHIGGLIYHEWMRPYIADFVPLIECTIHWECYRKSSSRLYTRHLVNLIKSIAQKQPTILERFFLYTDLNSTPELEDALILLVSSCVNLDDVRLEVNLLPNHVTNSLTSVFNARKRPVTFSFHSAVQFQKWRGTRNSGQ